MRFRPFTFEGIGLHTGQPCSVDIAPRANGFGVVFKTSVGDIPFNYNFVDLNSLRATNLRYKNVQVKTVEHLAAALAVFGISGAEITVKGPEIPALDGCALKWFDAFGKAGAKPCPLFFYPKDEIEIIWGDSHARLTPVAREATPHYCVELRYESKAIGIQRFEYRPSHDDFGTEIASARTFALESEVDAILKAGLGRGGSLDNALIIGVDGPVNSHGQRFFNEPARHKMLDLLGDLFLLGSWPWADIEIIRPGHKLTHSLIGEIKRRNQAG